MFVADPSTGKREESAQLVVHVNVTGKTVDIPMRYRATAAQPEREFWVAKWVVPQDTPVGIIRYTVTATDKYGRTRRIQAVRGPSVPTDDRGVRVTCHAALHVSKAPFSFCSRRPSARPVAAVQ